MSPQQQQMQQPQEQLDQRILQDTIPSSSSARPGAQRKDPSTVGSRHSKRVEHFREHAELVSFARNLRRVKRRLLMLQVQPFDPVPSEQQRRMMAFAPPSDTSITNRPSFQSQESSSSLSTTDTSSV
mmetsp:Transcript_15132/g.28326  ORF Transcript_15132/g.28326 Transcript_15132/m.28326 type:complete len:127 (-) Transcript_15132:290-670(-)